MIKKIKGSITATRTKESAKASIYESIEVTADDNARYFKNFFINHANSEYAKRNIFFLERLLEDAGIALQKKNDLRDLIGTKVIILVDDEDEYKNVKTISVIK